MKTAIVAKNIFGDKSYQERARKALPILVRQAKIGNTIFYQDLANELGIENPRTLNYPLGSIGKTLQELSKKRKEEIPPIQCLVINQKEQLPGEGVGWFIMDKDKFKNLSPKKKRKIINQILSKIFDYEKWDEIINDLGLQAFAIKKDVLEIIEKSALINVGGGGEGEKHKRLKQFIKDNPKSAGIDYARLKASIEKGLPSGDSMDISFENKKRWIGVEVKSEISNNEDIYRGIFQCVKYQAVMEALDDYQGNERNIEVILALGRDLPKSLIPVKNALGIKVVENIKPKK